LAARTHVLDVVVPPAPAAQSLGVASGVGVPLSVRKFFVNGAQAGAKTVIKETCCHFLPLYVCLFLVGEYNQDIAKKKLTGW
jgi:hypothetical protein